MYFVNRSEIEAIITNMDEILKEVKEDRGFSSTREKFALERIVHILIESILDVGNMMIDGFIMRDPGSYYDIIDILLDEKVLPKEDETSYKSFIDLRKMIVQDYLNINHDMIQETLFASKETLTKFSSHIRAYLVNELGVANAFSNES